MYATSPPVTPTPPPPPARTSSSRGTALTLAACAVLAVAVVASIALGARDISSPEVVRILLHPDAPATTATSCGPNASRAPCSG